MRKIKADLNDYLKKIDPEDRFVPDKDRPNLGWGDMYGMLPRTAKLIKAQKYPGLGIVRYYKHDKNIYATAINPDIDEWDVIGYCIFDDRSSELHVIDSAQGKGIGEEINYLYRKISPYAQTGGMTTAGKRAISKTYHRLVKEGIIEAMIKGSPEAAKIADLVTIKKYSLSKAVHEVLTVKNGYNVDKRPPNSKVIDEAVAIIKGRNEMEASDKTIGTDFENFSKETKAKHPELFKKKHTMDVLGDNYFTARSGKATDKEARQFALRVLQEYNKVPPGQLDKQSDMSPDLLKQLKKYLRISDNKSKEYIKKKYEGLNEDMSDIELNSSDTYTNKSKNVKLIYYANRSTAQTCKPGQTVKAKAGYGKRTSIKNATPEQLKQLKAGKWVRDRESGAKHNEPGAKQSKYRPALAKKSREAKKKKLTASEGINYKDFLKEVFGKLDK